jgi:two-component system, chemotaxis family, chemotaxis protein CheY
MKNQRTCLVVDDSKTIRHIMAGYVRDLRFDVLEASTGLHAVELCQARTPDVILLDWNMPVMDGITCLRVLRTMAVPKRSLVVMCTTENQIAKIQEALEAGADEYIMKPFTRDVLLDKFAQLDLV